MSDVVPVPGSSPPLDPDLQARLARVRAEEEKRHNLAYRVARERRVLLPLLALALLALPNFRTAKVLGHSMEPTLHPGSTLILLRTFRYFAPLKVGDIVVVKLKHGETKGEEVVKRVVFIQNDKGNARWPRLLATSRPSRPVPSDYWFHRQVHGREPVPPNGIVVMGDNIMNSMDSRDYGPIFDYEIVGKVMNP